MIHDRQITISIGNSRRSTNWQQATMLLSEFYAKLQAPFRSAETLADYMVMKKAQQDDLKDVQGGFMAGTLSGPRRKANNVTGRDVITLDFDNIPPGGTEDILRRLEALGINYCVYSTRKHHGAAPRLRILIPLDRTISADEYEPCARKMAWYIALEMADPTTFEVARLMYWPSCCADGEYVYYWADKPFVSADGLLAQYSDWRDVAMWPSLPGVQTFTKLAVKQGDPESKTGVVGAFCRVYNVYRAMDELLSGIYEPVDNMPDRYTYLGGSTTGGAVVYDSGKFLYSHHATDPCGGRLVNSFDMVRLHRFADLDDADDVKAETRGNRLPSYLKMIETAMDDKEVAAAIAKERMGAAEDFKSVTGDALEWATELQPGAQGGYQRSLHNFILVLQNHPDLHGCVRLNLLSNKKIAAEGLPWPRCAEDKSVWGDEDTTELCAWLERIFGKIPRSDIRNALIAVASRQSFHRVRDYLNSLTWDGVPRLDTLFIDYMGAEEENKGYTRAVTRKSIVAAVARVMTPGCVYQYMPVLIGKQGVKKSTFFSKLAGGTEFFSDSLKTFEGQKAQEGVRGKWILEIAEMQTFDKTSINVAKGFMVQQVDYYRAAYGEEAKDYPRQCVFFGTSNDYECLRDDTGGRRFWPVQTDIIPRKKDVFADLPVERDQIWAEAVMFWRMGETLYLPDELEEIAKRIQEEHREAHPWEDTIINFVNCEVPLDWEKWDLPKRRVYWEGNANYIGETKPRKKVCVNEIWLEALDGISINRIDLLDKRVIRNVMGNIPGWKKNKESIRFGKIYGVQKGYVRE